jgi:hypothetical protein
MKIIASIVKNEEDIIETFVRYHAVYFDKIIIVEHDSSDNTRKILKKLQTEYKKLDVIDEKSVWHIQSQISTRILNEYKEIADWFVFLDADEFIVFDKNLEDIVFEDNKLLMACWYNYVPTIETNDKNILNTITHRTKAINLNQLKAIVHRNIFKSCEGLYYVEGQHEVHYGKNEYINRNTTKHIKICHFPIRTINQMKSKYLIGWLSKLANPYNKNLKPEWSHWKKIFDMIKNKKEITYKDLQDTAAGYTYDHKDSKYDLICDPVFNDVILKYNDLIEDRDSFLNLTDFCEKLAWEFCQSKSI